MVRRSRSGSRNRVTCDCCPECGGAFDESAGVSPRLVEELPDPQPPEVTQYNRHHYECHSCGAETVASHPDCPDEGQFGVNVIAQAALSRYDHRLPYRKIGDRFEQLHGPTSIYSQSITLGLSESVCSEEVWNPHKQTTR